jgi:hypothetical protein
MQITEAHRVELVRRAVEARRIADDLGHLLRREPDAQDLQRVFRRLAIGQLVLAVREAEKIHVVGVAKTAHLLSLFVTVVRPVYLTR